MRFSELAKYFQKIEQTSSRLTITEFLSDVFKKTSHEEIGNVCYLLQGRVAPLYEPIEFGLADKFMIRAIALALETQIDDILKEFRKSGDLGTAAQELKEQKSQNRHESALSVSEVFCCLQEIARTGGEGSQEKKITLVSDVLKKLDPLSVRYIVRIPLGKLRLGFSDMTMLDALSWMITGDKSLREKLEQAYNVRSDIGFIAERVKAHGLDGVRNIHVALGTPVLSALCQRLASADEMIEKMGEVSVEPKYDGVRVQMHYKKLSSANSQLSAFSRNLENTTKMFPELEHIGRQLNAKSVILDCEAVGVDLKTGSILPFQQTTTRKRKHDIENALKHVPLRFYVFDILYKDGDELLGEPLSKRRDILTHTVKEGSLLAISPYIITRDAHEIRQFHRQQLHRGLEGVVVKKWDGCYTSGRRSYNWVKFKEDEGKSGKLQDTIDAVVMGYYYGEGKRSDFGIGAFLVGVKSQESIVTVTKIGTGVSDDQWKALVKRFEKLQEKKRPKEYEEVHKTLIPDVWLSPKIVVEIAGDDLTKSSTHGAGYAVRFPRLIRVREDKSPEEITTVNELQEMFKHQ
jgi:DNA ligase-1